DPGSGFVCQVKFTKKEVEDNHRISSISKKTKSVTACNDSSNSRTSNANAVCADCGKCVFNSDHDACVSRYLKHVNARTKKPNVVPISASKPKRKANKSVATPHKKTVASDTTIQKSKSYYKKLYENTNQEWKWWIAKRCPSGSNLSNVPSSSNSLADCTTHPIHCLVLHQMTSDQFAPILGYGDLIQGNVTIKRVYYVEGLNHNLFSVGQFCDADLEGNDLLTGNRGSDLYTISLQETTSSTPICFMAKAYQLKHGKAKKLISSQKYTWTLFLRSKDETPEVLKDFLTMIQRNLQAQVITVRTDRAAHQSLNKDTHMLIFKEEGIEHQTSTPRNT
ncbi:hypothetical protein Tco_0762260, partial [Tanacetum coccineum]